MKLHKWEDLEDSFKHNLLLGNGASIAVDKRFCYASLYESACTSCALSDGLQKLFEMFNVRDFEFVLRLLSNANQVNKILGVKETGTSEAYNDMKDALIKTIRGIHPNYDEVEACLKRIAHFMKRFKTVLSLNYDLLVYWAMLVGNDQYGPWFKDCFVKRGEFENDFRYLRAATGKAAGSTLAFYPHGNLILATGAFRGEMKLTSSEERLLDTILAEWKLGYCTPLFVSEGDTKDKLRAIKRSNYLTNVYDRVLPEVDESLVIYGWAVADQDKHILESLDRTQKLKKIAISVYIEEDDDWEEYCHRVEKKIQGTHNLSKCDLYFFGAESKGCWIH
jgi:hypothetical protein